MRSDQTSDCEGNMMLPLKERIKKIRELEIELTQLRAVKPDEFQLNDYISISLGPEEITISAGREEYQVTYGGMGSFINWFQDRMA